MQPQTVTHCLLYTNILQAIIQSRTVCYDQQSKRVPAPERLSSNVWIGLMKYRFAHLFDFLGVKTSVSVDIKNAKLFQGLGTEVYQKEQRRLRAFW